MASPVWLDAMNATLVPSGEIDGDVSVASDPGNSTVNTAGVPAEDAAVRCHSRLVTAATPSAPAAIQAAISRPRTRGRRFAAPAGISALVLLGSRAA